MGKKRTKKSRCPRGPPGPQGLEIIQPIIQPSIQPIIQPIIQPTLSNLIPPNLVNKVIQIENDPECQLWMCKEDLFNKYHHGIFDIIYPRTNQTQINDFEEFLDNLLDRYQHFQKEWHQFKFWKATYH